MWFYVRLFFIILSIGWLSLWVNIFSSVDRWSDYVQTSISGVPHHNEEFDFIVVGAGSAGSALAARLSKHYKVLLVEAGGTPIPLHRIPGLAFELMVRPAVGWMYESVEQKEAGYGFKNRRIKFPRGKSLGGSSNLNYMFYLRGHPLDYDNWANLTNDESWRYENVLRYFKKSLKYNGKFSENLKHYGKSEYGNLYVETRKYAPLRNEFFAAGKELGYDEIDVNANQRSGFGEVEATVRNGSRWGAYRAFLEDLIGHPNLVISKYSHATKVKLVKNRAVGLWYEHHGRKKFARAKREVILSCGSLDSPKLLMLSGIGPEKQLKMNGIKVKVPNEHVGQNLQDHPAVPLMPISLEKPLSIMPFRDFNLDQVISYFRDGEGVLSNPSAVGGQAFISSSFVKKTGVDWPDLQLYVFSSGHYETVVEDMGRVSGFNETVIQPIFEKSIGKDGTLILVTLVRPMGRGEVRLQDKNPHSPPLIDPKFLEHPQDVAVLIEGMKLATKIVETKPFKEIGAKFYEAPFPGCDQHTWKSDAYWKCFIRNFAFSLYHPTSTCSMNKVVDSKLRVIGVQGLRVADASVMPVIINANTNAISIAIGEMSADFIRDYWASQFEICRVEEPLLHSNHSKCFYSRMS